MFFNTNTHKILGYFLLFYLFNNFNPIILGGIEVK